jgi:hypothetical protein
MSDAQVRGIASGVRRRGDWKLMATHEPGKETPRVVTWRLRGKTYVASTTSGGLGRLDEDRAQSMTDEGAPALPARARDEGAG